MDDNPILKLSERALTALMWAFVLLMPITKIADYDFFFHLRLGERLIETGSFYLFDEFTFTAAGRPQYLLEWLSNGLMYLVFKYSGYYGLGLMKAALFGLIVFTATRTFRWVKPSGGAFAAALTVLVLAYAMRFRLDLRPYYFTYLFVAVFMYALIRYRAGGAGGGGGGGSGGLRVLFALVPVQVLWANTHGGMVMGPPLVTLFIAMKALGNKRPPRPGELLAVALLWAASGLGPAGYGPLVVFFSVLTGGSGETLGVLGEWKSLNAELLWGYGMRYTLGFQLIVLGALAHLVREAFKKRFDPFETALFMGAVYYSYSHLRLIAVASVLLAPLFYRAAVDAGGLLRKKRPAFNMALASVVVCLMVFTIFGSEYYAFGFGKKEGVLPDGALVFLEEKGITGRGFNTVTVGSYMLWASPGRKVLIDGRLNVPGEVHKGYEDAVESMEGFRRFDGAWGFSYAVVGYGQKSRWRYPLHLSVMPDWVPVYWDSTSVLYLKRTPGNREVIDGYGYRILRPSFNDFRYLDHHLKGMGAEELLGMVDADIALNPALQDARLAKAYLAYYLGMRGVARAELERAIELEPDTSFEHIALAQILIEAGERGEARRHLKRALRLEPSNPSVKELLKGLK